MKQKLAQQANQTLSNLRVESNCRHVVRVAFECSDASLCLVIPNLRTQAQYISWMVYHVTTHLGSAVVSTRDKEWTITTHVESNTVHALGVTCQRHKFSEYFPLKLGTAPSSVKCAWGEPRPQILTVVSSDADAKVLVSVGHSSSIPGLLVGVLDAAADLWG